MLLKTSSCLSCASNRVITSPSREFFGCHAHASRDQCALRSRCDRLAWACLCRGRAGHAHARRLHASTIKTTPGGREHGTQCAPDPTPAGWEFFHPAALVCFTISATVL